MQNDTATVMRMRAAGGGMDTFTAALAGPFGCDPCRDCGRRPPEGAVVWQNHYGDLYCDGCAQRRKGGGVVTASESLAIAGGLAGVMRWQALAEPVYAVSRFGRAVEFPAGTVIRSLNPPTNEPFPDAIRVVAADGSPFEYERTTVVRPDGSSPPAVKVPALWWVTASALRFEEGVVPAVLSGRQPAPCVCGDSDCDLRDDDGCIRVGDRIRILDPKVGRWKKVTSVSESFVEVDGLGPFSRRLLAMRMAEGRVEWRRPAEARS